MNRIQKMSHFFLIILKFLLVFLPVFVILKWIFIDAAFMRTSTIASIFLSEHYAGKYLVDVIWSPLAKSIGITAYFINLLPVLISLVALIRIFENYQKGEIFNAVNARCYHLIGWMFIFDGLISKIVYDAMMSVATTINNPPGERMIGFAFGSPNIEAIFCGIVMIIVSWVMLEASKLHDDQQYTV